jgi:hypothetical protein
MRLNPSPRGTFFRFTSATRGQDQQTVCSEHGPIQRTPRDARALELGRPFTPGPSGRVTICGWWGCHGDHPWTTHRGVLLPTARPTRTPKVTALSARWVPSFRELFQDFKRRDRKASGWYMSLSVEGNSDDLPFGEAARDSGVSRGSRLTLQTSRQSTAGILIALRLNLARREGADKLSGVRRQKTRQRSQIKALQSFFNPTLSLRASSDSSGRPRDVRRRWRRSVR